MRRQIRIGSENHTTDDVDRPHAVHAILKVGNRFVLQLRDDKPGISAPGMWSLFGGLLEKGETPEEALTREIEEELTIELTEYRHLWSFRRKSVHFGMDIDFTFYVSDISEQWSDCDLREGQAMQQFDFHELGDLNMPAIPRDVIGRYHTEFSVGASADRQVFDERS